MGDLWGGGECHGVVVTGRQGEWDDVLMVEKGRLTILAISPGLFVSCPIFGVICRRMALHIDLRCFCDFIVFMGPAFSC